MRSAAGAIEGLWRNAPAGRIRGSDASGSRHGATGRIVAGDPRPVVIGKGNDFSEGLA